MTEGDKGPMAANRMNLTTELARARYDAGDYAKAAADAREALRLAPEYPNYWAYGNAIHYGNIVLGRMAMRDGDRAEAARRLLVAGWHEGIAAAQFVRPRLETRRRVAGQWRYRRRALLYRTVPQVLDQRDAASGQLGRGDPRRRHAEFFKLAGDRQTGPDRPPGTGVHAAEVQGRDRIAERFQRQGGAGGFLGNVVLAVPRGNADVSETASRVRRQGRGHSGRRCRRGRGHCGRVHRQGEVHVPRAAGQRDRYGHPLWRERLPHAGGGGSRRARGGLSDRRAR